MSNLRGDMPRSRNQKAKNQVVCVRLPVELVRELRRVANIRGESISEVIRALLTSRSSCELLSSLRNNGHH